MPLKKQNNLSVGTVAVYLAQIPEGGATAPIDPPERSAEIEAVSSDSVRLEKYYAWRLLELAVRECFAMELSEASLVKMPSGAWSSPYFSMSISHSGGIVAVALSAADNSVGVDIEPIAPLRRQDKMAQWLLSPNDIQKYGELPEEDRLRLLLGQWTSKEAAFKALGESAFKPSELLLEDFDGLIESKILSVFGIELSLSVASRAHAEISEARIRTLV